MDRPSPLRTSPQEGAVYLKHLDIMGFKSFFDQVHLDFEPGITAIVGPNGSGKSNIAEAIRWVLGEQNPRELRGARMEDVISAGSARRKPLGLAEVSLTLDNTDGYFPIEYAEIALTRQVDRSGVSDYFINRVPVRHRDVGALIAGSGIGRGAYAFIGQGKVDEILSARPEERRPVFEEAAGVARHKQQKGEAERLLGHAEAHLVRLRDILAEMGRHLQPLRMEAERAERYREATTRLRDVELQMLAGQAQAARRRLDAATTQSAHLAEEARRAEVETAARQADRDRCRERLEAIQGEIDALNQRVLVAAQAEERARGSASRLKEALDGLARQEERLRKELAELAGRAVEHEAGDAEEAAALARVRTDINECHAEIGAYHQTLADLDDRRSAATAALKQAQDELFDAMAEAAKARNAAATLSRERQLREREIERLAQEAQAVADEAGRLADRAGALRGEAAAAEVGLAEGRERREGLKAERESLARAAEEQERRTVRLREQLHAARSRLELLRELEESYEGYARGTRAALRGRDEGQTAYRGVAGAVASLVRPQAGMETAIEAALGPAVHHLVVECEEDARRAIEQLKQDRAGRATFLPLDTIRPGEVPEQDLALGRRSEALGWAADLVEHDIRLRPAVAYLLARVLVARDLPGALVLARATGHRYRIVTLDGDVIHSGGAVTGGSAATPGRTSGLLARVGEIDRLAAEVARTETALAEAEREQAGLRERLSAVGQAWEEAVDAFRREELRLEHLRREMERLDQDERHLGERLSVLHARRQELEAEADASHGQGAEPDVVAAESCEKALRQRVSDLEGAAATLDREREAVAGELVQARVRLASLEQEEQGRRRWEDGLRVRREELDQAVASGRQALDETERERRRLEEDLAAAVREEAACAADKGAGQAQLSDLQARRDDLQRTWRSEESAVARCQEALRGLEERLRTVQVEEARATMELRSHLRDLSGKFRLGEEEVMALPTPDQPDRLEGEVSRLRAEVSGLGPVNLRAEEEYRSQSERYSTLAASTLDLETAMTRLRKLADAVGEEIEVRFTALVREVRHHFQDVFAHLFGGGQADLIVVEREEGPAAGVEVAVQPPGKKLQHLSLLSGGERALAAIALLFAFLRVRPAPFCVLDEIDAALDESNVARFARYLREVVDARGEPASQFIIITHQKVTMEAADRLFGVTMDDAGGSRLVSVRLGTSGRSGAA